MKVSDLQKMLNELDPDQEVVISLHDPIKNTPSKECVGFVGNCEPMYKVLNLLEVEVSELSDKTRAYCFEREYKQDIDDNISDPTTTVVYCDGFTYKTFMKSYEKYRANGFVQEGRVVVTKRSVYYNKKEYETPLYWVRMRRKEKNK